MIHIVTAENRNLYRHALTAMHQQRKALFVDQMRWPLDTPEGLEIDEFDADDTTYLIHLPHADGERTFPKPAGSVRLLPTDRPHLLGEHFAHLCPLGVPRSPLIWEVSRFCPAPETPKGQARRNCLALMIAAIMETGLLFGVERVTFVASAALTPLAMKVGWRVQPLGPSVRADRDRLTALVAAIDIDGLRCVRERNGLGAPVTRFTPGQMARAA